MIEFNNKLKVVFYRSGISGGTGTLALRAGIELMSLGYEVYYLYYQNNSVDNSELMRLSGIKTVLGEKKDILTFVKKLTVNAKTYFICYTLEEYIDLVKALHDSKNNYDVFIYNVGIGVLGIGFPSDSLSCFIKKLLNWSILRGLYEKQKVLFFNQYDENSFINAYNFTKNDAVDEYFPIPIICNNFKEGSIKKRWNDHFTIIAIARADFPFKGFLLAVVDVVDELIKENYDIKLDIITTLEGSKLLLDRVNEKTNSTRERISIQYDVNYETINDTLGNYRLNIGMGTTVLDASSHFVPSLVANINSFKPEVVGRFADCGEVGSFAVNVFLPMKAEIEKIYHMNYEEYLCLCKADFAKLKKYDIKIFINNLIKKFNDKPYYPKRKEIFLANVKCLLANIHKIIFNIFGV